MASTELRMLTEFLRLTGEEDEDGFFEFVEEEQELLEAPLGFLSKIFKKKVSKDAPVVTKAPSDKPLDQKPVAKATPSYGQDPTPQKKSDPAEKQSKKTYKPAEKWISSGCVVFDSVKDMSKVYVIKQKNWGTWAFPKGRVDKGESIKKAAVREVAEETGLTVSLMPSGYLGKGMGSMSITHFFAAVRTGGSPGQHDHEVEKVALVSFTEAFKLFKRSGGKAGKRDMMMLRKAWEYANKYRKGKVPEWPGSKK